MAASLVWSREQLLAEHAYAQPHEVAGRRLHGGFDAAGSYVPPRTLHRWPAVRAWQHALAARGCALIEATTQLLSAGSYPSWEQQKLLLQHGLGETFWNALTITGVIEARGRLLIGLPAPDFQDVVLEDLSGTATGHLTKGLLAAHGMDEGGDPRTRLGAHDEMWFAIRDLVFGENAYPLPEVPASIARPDGGRLAPDLPIAHEQLLALLMNVLMIEIRAEHGFASTQRLLADPELFTDRRAEARLGHEMVERIRSDEAVHVAYLQLVLSELRSFTLVASGGRRVPGHAILDPMWATLVHWHAVESPRLARAPMRDALHARLQAHRDRERLVTAFEALG